jgi:hypothetical protein
MCAILVAFFVLAIGLVRVLGRMIDRDADPEGFADVDGAPDGGTPGTTGPDGLPR